MAGVHFHIEFDDDKAQAGLKKLSAASGDLSPAMRDIGNYLVNTTRDRFHSQQSPDGVPWAPLSSATKARKQRNRGKILTEGGALQAVVMQADSSSVAIGSPLVYAGTHQFGAARGAFGTMSSGRPIPWGDIPARPFLGLSNEDEGEVGRLVADFLIEQLG